MSRVFSEELVNSVAKEMKGAVPRDCGAGHQLPMRAGAGDARRDYGRQRHGRKERHTVQDCGLA